jgi:sugar phosphate isomerase/epimerase
VLAELGGDTPLEICLKDAADIGYEGMELGTVTPGLTRQSLHVSARYHQIA